MPVVVLSRDCPGYAEAARREDELRSVPFLGLDERIAGLPAAPLTLRRVQFLTMVKSPMLAKLDIPTLIDKPGIAEDIMAFLWIVSPKFEAGNARAKKKFFKTHGQVLKMDAAKVIGEALEYVEEAFMDAGDSDGEQRNYYSTAAAVVGFFSRNYGLQIDVWENSPIRRLIRKWSGQPNILDIPLKIAFQLIRVHQKSNNPEATFQNRLSQPKVDEWIAGMNQAARN
jgi:hypothetical protein